MNSTAEQRQQFYSPNIVTKQLKLNEVGGRRKVRISSNFLPLVAGFKRGDRITVVPSMDGGFNIRPSERGEYQVHSRAYRRKRTNNPFETVIEFANQDLIRQTFPAGAERFHVQMRGGEVRVRPLPNRAFSIRRRFTNAQTNRALVAMTGGVDVHCLSKAGFETDFILEYRPQEARDLKKGASLEEVHALNTLCNGAKPRALLNESIYDLDPAKLRQLVDEGNPVSLAHLSLVCDDHSSAKSASQKAASVADLSTGVDMIYPALKVIEKLEAPVIVVENVRGFQHSDAGVIFKSMLRRFGYHVHESVLDARSFGGIQGRKRYYLVASIFPGFESPAEEQPSTASIWPIIERHLSDCRDVTSTRAIELRGRYRNAPALLTPQSTFCPTILKSQDRGIKDAVYIQHGDRVLAPSEGLIKDLMSIPSDFDVSWMAKEQAIETLGQSIDYQMHHAVMLAVKAHIESNLGKGPILRHSKQMPLAV